jgi:hypothetical protein
VNAEQADNWWAGMLDVQTKSLEFAVKEVNRLRGRVRDLEAQIEATPGIAWELQERVSLLESLIKARAA